MSSFGLVGCLLRSPVLTNKIHPSLMAWLLRFLSELPSLEECIIQYVKRNE
jgi:hypothetical protein